MSCEADHAILIRAWLGGSLHTAAVVEGLRPHFSALVLDLHNSCGLPNEEIWLDIPPALDHVRESASQGKELSCRSLLKRLGNALWLLPEIRDAMHLQHQLRYMSTRIARSSREGKSRPEPEWPRESPDRELTDLTMSLPDLATAFDQFGESDRPLLRLLSLRVIGGWSLREIAKRDNAALDRVVDQWAKARALLERTNSPLGGSIVTFDLLDLHVLNTLIRDPSLHRELNWRTFERLLAAILERLGYEIELQRGTKDGGTDIIAIKRQTEFGAHRYLVQAKRWSAKVGIEPVRELLFLRQHVGATKACLATTSTFTAGARQLAREYQWCLELRDYERLQDWIHQAFPFLPSL